MQEEDLFGRVRDVPTYKETLPGGVSHTIIQIEGDNGFYDNTAVYKVPPDNYFMMGDNRDNSTDSRVPPDEGGVGYVPAEDLVGRAELIFFSVKKGEASLGLLGVALDRALGSAVQTREIDGAKDVGHRPARDAHRA